MVTVIKKNKKGEVLSKKIINLVPKQNTPNRLKTKPMKRGAFA